jgi:hypothetical protein
MKITIVLSLFLSASLCYAVPVETAANKCFKLAAADKIILKEFRGYSGEVTPQIETYLIQLCSSARNEMDPINCYKSAISDPNQLPALKNGSVTPRIETLAVKLCGAFGKDEQ